jgi:hypothetical protein
VRKEPLKPVAPVRVDEEFWIHAIDQDAPSAGTDRVYVSTGTE